MTFGKYMLRMSYLIDETSKKFPGAEGPSIVDNLVQTTGLQKYSYGELKAATKNFRSDTVRGQGGFGKVYMGRLKRDSSKREGSSQIVAIKKLKLEGSQRHKEWETEVKLLGNISHQNIVKLLGSCEEGDELLLVYEYMAKGSLENHLFGGSYANRSLPWEIRIKILIDAAIGTHFLHSSERQVINRDIKSSNILLDGLYNAKISYFDLAKLRPTDKSYVNREPKGTFGYLDPAYFSTGYLYVKSDVYWFGMVMLETLSGQRAMDMNRPNEEVNLAAWAKPNITNEKKMKKIMDPRLGESYSAKSALKIAKLALKCLETEPELRPTMKDVLDTLKDIYANDSSHLQRAG